MATGVQTWSQTAATNATADANVNWAEQMAPSQVNDSARAMMASVAKWRDDNNSVIFTGGTNTAYTASSNQGFTSFAQMDTARICLTFLAANGASPTLNIDGLGPKPLLDENMAAIVPGFISKNATYDVVFSNGMSAWFFITMGLNTFIPSGAMMPYAGASAPNGWLICDGAGYSRSTFATLFAAISTTYGSSDGSSFKVPDTRDKVLAGKGSGSILSFSAVLGSTGGDPTVTLTSTQMPVHNHTATGSDSGHTHNMVLSNSPGSGSLSDSGNKGFATSGTTEGLTISGTANISVTVNNAGSGGAHSSVQPTLIVNHIIKT